MLWFFASAIAFVAGVNWLWWAFDTEKLGDGLLWANLAVFPTVAFMVVAGYCLVQGAMGIR